MAKKSWFDPTTNSIMFMEYRQKMESWQEALRDGQVREDEIAAQVERVTQLLKALEPKLNDELHAELTTLFYELAVLYGLQQIHEMQSEQE